MYLTIDEGSNFYASGKDNINILTYLNSKWKFKFLADICKHVPRLKLNLFSYGTASDKGLKLTSDNKKFVFIKMDKQSV